MLHVHYTLNSLYIISKKCPDIYLCFKKPLFELGNHNI